jgi:hypothetical protein
MWQCSVGFQKRPVKLCPECANGGKPQDPEIGAQFAASTSFFGAKVFGTLTKVTKAVKRREEVKEGTMIE